MSGSVEIAEGVEAFGEVEVLGGAAGSCLEEDPVDGAVPGSPVHGGPPQSSAVAAASMVGVDGEVLGRLEPLLRRGR